MLKSVRDYIYEDLSKVLLEQVLDQFTLSWEIQSPSDNFHVNYAMSLIDEYENNEFISY